MIVLSVIMVALIVVAFAITTLTARSLAKSEDSWTREKAGTVKRIRAIVCIVLAVILAVILGIKGFRIVDSTEIGVVRTFGEITRTIDSGPNFINPLTDTVQSYDLRVHVKEATFASYTKDAQPLTAAIEYQYALDPATVMDVAREYGSYEILETKLDNVVQEKAKVVFAKYSAMTLLENRSTLSAEVMEEVRSLEELYNVNFSSVIVKDIDFSDAFEASVEAKMTAEQDALRAEQEKKTALIQAEQKKEVAAINAEAAIATAEGEAKAMQITREALQNMPEAYIQSLYLDKWNGVLPQIVTDGNNLMINPDIGQ